MIRVKNSNLSILEFKRMAEGDRSKGGKPKDLRNVRP